MLTGILPYPSKIFGRTRAGLPLEYFTGSAQENRKGGLLLIAGIHGEEADGVFVLSRALRACAALRNCTVVLCANPEGLLRGTRANGRGVDLNRNFPSRNWRSQPVMVRSFVDGPRDLALSPGDSPSSEPEIHHLLAMLRELKPDNIISIHSPLGCVDAPKENRVADFLAEQTGLQRVYEIGYETPGSFGSWADENGHRLVTFELPKKGGEDLVRNYSPVFAGLMENGMDG